MRRCSVLASPQPVAMSDTATSVTRRSTLDLGPLRARFAGELITPADRRYDDARRVFNAIFDRRPSVIACATNASDVAVTLEFARRHDLPVAVRGGGHSVAGYSTVDGGIVIDLLPMERILVDATARRVRVQPGVTWGELDRATQKHGLATTGGRMTTTGVARFTLGSGSGWLERLHGLACDNLLAAEVVLADGHVVTTDDSENADLFWGLKGGGGNFGVVTEFEFRLHPAGPVLIGGLVLHPGDRALEVGRFFRDFMRDAPRQVGAGLVLMHAPLAPFVPLPLQGQPAIGIIAAYFGPIEDGAAGLAPLKDLASPAVDLIGPTSYVDLQAITDAGNPPGRRNYWRSGLLTELSDEAIDTVITCSPTVTSPASVLVLSPIGGAVADVPDDATPISGRTAPWLYHCYGIWTDTDDERHIGWVRATERAMRPFTTDGVAMNFVSDISAGRVRRTFGDEKYRRLQELKAKYDPENVFRLNQNVTPASP